LSAHGTHNSQKCGKAPLAESILTVNPSAIITFTNSNLTIDNAIKLNGGQPIKLLAKPP